MLTKTHLAIGFFAALFFISSVQDPLIFLPAVLIATIIPDVDSQFSAVGRKWFMRPLQIFFPHRGVLHSFTFCILVALILSVFLPVLAFPFFLGYGLHLFLDAFTVDGLRPFWPWNKVSQGRLRVGGTIEESIFVTFCIVDVIFLIFLLLSL